MGQYEKAARAKLAEIERLKAEFAPELAFDGELKRELFGLLADFYAICERAKLEARHD